MTNESAINREVGWNEYRKQTVNDTSNKQLKCDNSVDKNLLFEFFFSIYPQRETVLLGLGLDELNETISPNKLIA